MMYIATCRARAAVLAFLFSLSWFSGSAHAQDPFVFTTIDPYNGTFLPLDLSKEIFSPTMAGLCPQRTDGEIVGTYYGPPFVSNVLYVGFLPQGTVGTPNGVCGYQYLNVVDGASYIITVGVIPPNTMYCSQVPSFAATNPNAALPQWCLMACPDDQKSTDGSCLVLSEKQSGKPCPKCGNPVNPATGNKYEEETDLAPVIAGGLSLTRYYNTGRATPLTRVFGGFWQHTYSRKITVRGIGDQAAYYSSDGKVLTFHLVAGAWVADGDVADVLLELKDASGKRTGWTFTVAANDDTEAFDASGNALSIRTRSGLTTSFVYSDGTDGAASGGGGFFLDASGNSTGVLLEKGLLLRVTDAFGRALQFGYDSSYRIVKITDPAGGAILYGYGARSTLTSVTYPDGKQRQYLYNEPAQTGGATLPYNLTGIVDENGARFATFAYDSFGRAIKTTYNVAGGGEVNRYTLTYDVPGGQTTIVDPLGTARPNGWQTVVGVVKQTAETQPVASGTGTASTAIGYDTNGNVASRTDFNGNRTSYTYDLTRNLEISRTEGLTSSGATTPQTRTITTEWHATFRLPTRTAEPLRITTNAYDPDGSLCGARGALCSRTVQATSGATRTWTYTYNANGQVLTVNGPRSDVSDITTYTYDAQGNVASITNAAGHLTSITAYNAHGQLLTIVDPNGMSTTLAYDARQRLTSRNSGGEVTSYDYDGVGQLTKVTLPDGSFLSYSYDAAHRLTGMQDNLGNSIAYTLDAIGNRTLEQVFDPASALAQKRSRVYSSLNRLFQELGAQNQTTEYAYDDQGNVVSVKDPLNHVTANQYDALNRLKQVTDPNLGLTQYAYNGLDALTQVTDPRSLVTGYTVDGLGNLTQQSSPDTGTTVNTYDAAGNLLTQTDAKGQVTTYAYDALNRVTLITFHDGSKQTYAYDQGPNGIGRLSSIVETDPALQVTSQIAYAYDLHGRVVSETRTVSGIAYVLGYSYDSAGRLTGLTYPSGRTVTYAFDALGRVNQVNTTKGTATQIVV